jgi:GT2 family glycosyltransferase
LADRSLIVVNYRSAALCRGAVQSARDASSEPLEIVIVDNSCDPREAAALESIGADRLIVAGSNLGYAGGANAGIAASSGSVAVVSNPDIVFAAGCVDRLAEVLGGRVALSGPRFSWDAGGAWLLPPAEVTTLRGEVSRRLASRSAVRAMRRSRRRFLDRVAFWRAASPLRVAAVSGALMAVERNAWRRVGKFDERYRLYYEEIDFMRALGREGLELRHVPAARCRHIYDQSAASEAEHRDKFAESEMLYLEKWHGPGVRLLRLLESGDGVFTDAAVALPPSGAIGVPSRPEDYVVEASPLESFDTAAGHFPERGEVRVPAEIWESFHGSALFVRVVEAATGREVSRGVLRKSA